MKNLIKKPIYALPILAKIILMNSASVVLSTESFANMDSKTLKCAILFQDNTPKLETIQPNTLLQRKQIEHGKTSVDWDISELLDTSFHRATIESHSTRFDRLLNFLGGAQELYESKLPESMLPQISKESKRKVIDSFLRLAALQPKDKNQQIKTSFFPLLKNLDFLLVPQKIRIVSPEGFELKWPIYYSIIFKQFFILEPRTNNVMLVVEPSQIKNQKALHPWTWTQYSDHIENWFIDSHSLDLAILSFQTERAELLKMIREMLIKK